MTAPKQSDAMQIEELIGACRQALEEGAAFQAGLNGVSGTAASKRAQRAAYRQKRQERAEANWKACGGLAVRTPEGNRPAQGEPKPLLIRIEAKPERGPSRSPGARPPQAPQGGFSQSKLATVRQSYPRGRRFDRLFSSERHFRSDCILFLSAIKRGWLDNEPLPVIRALWKRFNTAQKRLGLSLRKPRHGTLLLRHCQTRAAVAFAILDEEIHQCRYALGARLTGQTVGRPRRYWRRIDLPKPITLEDIGYVFPPRDGGNRASWTAHMPTGSYGVTLEWTQNCSRSFFVCPRCGKRRSHLYTMTVGLRCRVCLRAR